MKSDWRTDLPAVVQARPELVAELAALVANMAGGPWPTDQARHAEVRHLLEAVDTAAAAIDRIIRGDGETGILRAICGPETLRDCRAHLERIASRAQRQARLTRPRRGHPRDSRALVLAALTVGLLKKHGVEATTAPDGPFARTVAVCLDAAGLPAGTDLYRSRLRPALLFWKRLPPLEQLDDRAMMELFGFNE